MRFYGRNRSQPGNDSNRQFLPAGKWKKGYRLSAGWFEDSAVTETLQEGGAHDINAWIGGIQEFPV